MQNRHETIVSIGLGGNDEIMRPEPTLVYVMQYNLDILIKVVVTRKNKQVLGLKGINTWLGFFIKWIRWQIGDYLVCLHMLILGIYMFFDIWIVWNWLRLFLLRYTYPVKDRQSFLKTLLILINATFAPIFLNWRFRCFL